jgi:hypothetical protein
LLLLEFWPLQMTPTYVPIHRLPRFLYPLALPAAILIGLSLQRWWRAGTIARVAVGGVALLYAGTGLWWSARAVAFHNDTMLDPRFAGQLAARWTGSLMTDEELQPYLWFRRRGQNLPTTFVPLADGVRVPAGTLALVGGSRRPELDPRIAAGTGLRRIPPHWIPVAEMPGDLAPWRLTRGAAYVVVRETPGDTVRDTPQACPPGPHWALKDVIDVGNATSEAAHGYAIDGQTWSGERVLGLDETQRWDDGRAFVGSQRFRADSLATGLDICIVKRVDAGVAPQASVWTVDEQALPMTTFAERQVGAWGTVVLTVPGHMVRGTSLGIRERFMSSAVDVNAFRVEIYQAMPAPQ